MSYPIDTSHQSPNHSSRDGAPITMLVWHATAGSYVSSLAWLCNPASKVSAHYLIREDGHIDQLVADDLAAWHAGRSQWFGLDSEAIRDQSIGIELVNDNTGHDPYPLAQLDAATWLGRVLVGRYRIAQSMVVRHLDIAQPPGRKTDPAGLPWPQFRNAIYLLGSYRAVTCAPIFQDRRPDAVLAGSLPVGQIEAMNDLDSGWLHLRSGWGFTPLSCWEPI